MLIHPSSFIISSMSERHTISHIRRMLEDAGLKPRHDLGQNFLVDLNLLDLVIHAAELTPDDLVLEVGTGTGSLTAQLAEQAGQVVAVEFDPQMATFTARAVSHRDNVTLLNQDALRNKNHLADEVLQALRSYSGRYSTLKLVANLPYNAATPIISNLISTDLPWTRMVVTIQYELAERMTAVPRTGDYSALSVWLQSQCRLEILRKLPPTVFWPKPKVDSAIVRIDRDPARQDRIQSRPLFHDFLRDIFTQRRKHLLGVVAKLVVDQIDRSTLEAIHHEFGWPTTIRAEELTVDQFVDYHNRLLAIRPSLALRAP